MVTIGMNYSVLPGKEAVFERAFEAVLGAMRAEEGHVRSTLFLARGGESPGASYLILSEWADQATFQRFVRSEAFGRVTRWGREEILAGPPRHELFERSAAAARPS